MIHSYFDACVEQVIDTVGPDLVMAIPLGLGKPNRFVNALYERVRNDPKLSLTIVTALTLERPQAKSELEKRFLDPLLNRILGDYPDLDYALDRRKNNLPKNIRVIEFFYSPGSQLGNARAQQDYISSNYTHVARDMIDRGVNVLAQLVAFREIDGVPRYSLSCNPDVTLELAAKMKRRRADRHKNIIVAEINRNLPFMYHDAMVADDYFDAVVDKPDGEFHLFSTPRPSINDVDYMIGLNCSTLIKDGGTLQIGIGSLGDAVAYALKLRHEINDDYRNLVSQAKLDTRYADLIEHVGGLDRFDQGLFGATEMLVDGFLQLYRCGVIKRKVYDDLTIQGLLNQGSIRRDNSIGIMAALVASKRVSQNLTPNDVRYLKSIGIFNEAVETEDGMIIVMGGIVIKADLLDPDACELIEKHCLGSGLKGGTVIHGGFFLGPNDFYDALRNMDRDECELIRMTGVEGINQLYGNEMTDRTQRYESRFLNTCLMATLNGSIVSDGLDDGRVVSGVGGQYNFVAMAHAMPDGRSILQVRSTRERDGQVSSNIVYNYAHTTIPRHLRDFVVSEYGIANLRGKTDSEVIREMLNITDSNFQDSLRRKAVVAGKLPHSYRIPDEYRNNTPERLRVLLATARAKGHFPPFPFGTEFTDIELTLGKALKNLQKTIQKPTGKARLAWDLVGAPNRRSDQCECFERMGLMRPKGIRERVYGRLLNVALNWILPAPESQKPDEPDIPDDNDPYAKQPDKSTKNEPHISQD